MAWKAGRESGYRTLFVGAFSLAIAFIIYSSLSGTSGAVQAQDLTGMAYATLAITAASMAAATYGAYRIFGESAYLPAKRIASPV